MSSTDTNLEGRRLSFYQLFTNKNYILEVPIIQRDYAQGRKSTFEVRELFLDALHDYLEENKPNRDLDFVYGSTEQEEEIEKFIPLDGQQRLTTLFLLHWYLSILSGNFDEFKEVMSFENKSKFTYLTRTSSTEFCDALLNNKLDFDKLLKSDKNESNSLSKTIKDAGWFFLSWENDPTIQSMLTMLDSIHNKFNNYPHFYKRLVETVNPIITFLYLDLGEFKLTEDLYIKMNSRGKTLTKFENFKAKFEQHIDTLDWETEKPYKLTFSGVTKSVTTKEYFSFKIDTSWANLFWHYRKLKGDPNTFDDELMNFIRTIVTNQNANDCDPNFTETLEYLLGTFTARKRADYSDYISFYKYHSFNVLSKNTILYLISALDSLENGNNKVKQLLNNSFYFDEGKFFEKALSFDFKLPEIVQYHAYLKFLIVNKDDKSGLHHWMRVVYNLTENTNIDGATEVQNAIKSIEKILPYSNDILSYLVSGNKKIDFFYGRQVQEEQIKALLIRKSEEWKKAVETIEQNQYFAGQICFVLDYSEILDYYETNNNLNWSEDEELKFFNLFKNYAVKAGSFFNILGTETNENFLLERAVLTKGDYLIGTSYDRYNFLSTKKNPRDYSWKRLLRLPPLTANETEQKEWKSKRSLVKEVLDDEKFSINDIKKSLSEICKNIPLDWRKYFVGNANLIRYCSQGFISFYSEDNIKLLMHKQLNHRHREMFTYNLYHKYFLNQETTYLPFKKFYNHEIKSSDDYSGLILEGWCYNKIYYHIEVYKIEKENKYDLYFLKSKSDRNLENHAIEIRTILDNNKINWDADNKYFMASKFTEANLISTLKKICSEFNNL
ncbi:DUF262 domain-containing protein [Flavobacterium sp. SUN046]|uniref:DUF262 domain-containing protein n=1 Tax=Flavobacterium sp. SUN046 TaxID=3002440 RepID=UPI002DB67A19|nr:DUF262 domain-containing protein [Flavobacterium sp. SUN046]MEC4049132.1 DUF262 domain-containing protein [Flavobacterium sp. SUN046]